MHAVWWLVLHSVPTLLVLYVHSAWQGGQGQLDGDSQTHSDRSNLLHSRPAWGKSMV